MVRRRRISVRGDKPGDAAVADRTIPFIEEALVFHLNSRRLASLSLSTLLAVLVVVGSATFGRAAESDRTFPTYELPVTLSIFAREFGQILSDRGVSCAGVLDFAVRARGDQTPAGALQQLAERCSNHLVLRLTQRTTDSCRIINSERAREALRMRRVFVDDLTDVGPWEGARSALPEATAVVQGTILSIDDNRVELECALVDLTSGETIVRLRGSSVLGFSDWVMLGRSAILPNYRSTRKEVLYEEDLLDQLKTLGEGAHPMRDAHFAFPIQIVIGDKPRKGAFFGNSYCVPISKDEEFSIQLQNRDSDIVHVKLLIDGCDTLPRKTRRSSEYVFEPAPRIMLTEARNWTLEPANKATSPEGIYAIRGFLPSNDTAEKLIPFKVGTKNAVRLDENSPHQLGIVTAAFYTNHDTHYSPRYRDLDSPFAPRHEIGNLIGVVQIRLIDASTMPGMP